MWGLVGAGVSLIALLVEAHAADIGSPTAVKAPTASAPYDWTGFYLGAHLGYGAGSSNWSVSSTGNTTPALASSLNLFNPYDIFTGTGSYFAGFQAGYNYLLPSRILVGIEADASFPNLLSGTQTGSSPPLGQTSYQDQAEFSGTVRTRIGYAAGPWLFYVTGGLAYGEDQITRTQPAGGPVSGKAPQEALLMIPHLGGVGGGGVEFALTTNWAARLEYLYSSYGMQSVSFQAPGQRFDSNLSVQSLSVGLDYRLGNGINPEIFTKGMDPLDMGWAVMNGQVTFIEQYAAPFRAPYSGVNSLASNAGRETADLMLAGGFKLWRGAELWIDPELGQGFGLSNTEGVAGFTSGAAFRVGATIPYPRIQRTFIRQTIDLGGETQKVDADFNQFAG